MVHGAKALLFMLCVMAAAPASAATKDRPSHTKALQKAEALYDDYRFDLAIAAFEKLLGDTTLSDEAVRQRALFLLSSSYFLRQREQDAAATLQRLFYENPKYVVDRVATPPEVLTFFDAQLAKFAATPRATQKTESLVAAPASEPKAEQTIALRPVETLGDQKPALRILPLGIGHFVNSDGLGGGLFLGVELALVATHLASALVRNTYLLPSGRYQRGTPAIELQYVQNLSVLAFVIVVGVEILDAFLWSPARGRKNLQDKLTVDLGPLGSYRLAFQ